MNTPASFATLSTDSCKQELAGFLLSLSIHHPDAKVYIMCDTKTKEYYDDMSFKPRLQLKWFTSLDKYTAFNRAQMEAMNIWSEFQMSKSHILDEAMKIETDCLFLDSDIIITHTINDIDKSKALGVSPGFIQQEIADKYGFYNGGMLWISDKNIPNKWRQYTKTSRYYDQASIEDLHREYSQTNNVFDFGEEYNVQSWRFIIGKESGNQLMSYIRADPQKGMLWYKNKPLKFLHTHFNHPQFAQLNNYFIKLLTDAKMYRELLSIFRCINNKWVIRIPKQPMQGMGRHANDSFREIPVLLKLKNKDIDIKYDSESIHCKLEPNIILYDRPTLEWVNDEMHGSSLLLLGNGNIHMEGLQLKNHFQNINIKPWTFWPRKPMLVEKLLKQNKRLEYAERKCNTVFIGNYENSIQDKYRNKTLDWKSVIDEYHCTAGQNHLFTHEEYLMKLRQSRYGLCLRGYGSKCHREVELMAFGTVPIVTPEVSIKSYMNPPIENTHYIVAKTPDELKEKIQTIAPEQWEAMSKACYEWYQKNVGSDNMWVTMMEHIFYVNK